MSNPIYHWWSVRNGQAATVYCASSERQAIVTIAEDFRLGAVQRLRLEKNHSIEVDGWKIALQKPEESSTDFFDRSCGQTKTAVRSLPIANRRPQQEIRSSQVRP